MTLLVATLTETTPEALRAAAAGVETDLLEVRLDSVKDLDDELLALLPRLLPRPLIATLRPTWEGGLYAGPEDARERLLLKALHAGFYAVDVESRAAFADRLLESGGRVILSEHHLDRTPPTEDLLKRLQTAADRGAWVAKLAVRFDGATDASAAVTAARRASREGLRFALMAVNDSVLRLTAPALGMALAYVAPTPAGGAVAGQPLWRDAAVAHAALAPPLPQDARLVFLFGDPVSHSASPHFQNAAFHAAGIPFRYVAQRVPAERVGAAVASLRALDAAGANVTLPHKTAVMPHLDEVAASGELAGAVNTIVNRDGRLVGHNTDGAGAVRALREAGVTLRGARILLLGAGGAARGIMAALLQEDCFIQITNRSAERAKGLAFAMGTGRVVPWEKRHEAEFDLLVNATSVGLHDSEMPFSPAHLATGQVVFDAVYAPGGTELARRARERGCRVVPGEAMLLHQGAEAFELWTGRPAPVLEMRRALANALEVRA